MESYPNHLKSIPRSIGRLKHYFDVHDQPFVRSVIYLVILSVLVTVVGMVVGYVGFVREAGRQGRELTGKLVGVLFEGGRLTASGEQPRVPWRDVRTVSFPKRGKDGETIEEKRQVTQMVAVLDTTGKLETLEQAAEFAGCPEPARYVFFGAEQIESFEVAESRARQSKPETIAYDDTEKLAELRKLVEENGGTVPAIEIKDGVASFDLPPDKVHVLVRTSKLMALVDTSGEKRSMGKAVGAAFNEDAEFRARVERPEFVLFVGAEQAVLKPVFSRRATTWAFADGEAVTPATLGEWAAGEVRNARMKATLQQALPWFLYGLVFLFIGARICSVAGLIVNGSMRAGLAYGEVLTIAIYAITPALAAFMVAVLALQGQGSPWVLAVALVVGMVYTALGTRRTAVGLTEESPPTI